LYINYASSLNARKKIVVFLVGVFGIPQTSQIVDVIDPLPSIVVDQAAS
jgi:hypothetical protein